MCNHRLVQMRTGTVGVLDPDRACVSTAGLVAMHRSISTTAAAMIVMSTMLLGGCNITRPASGKEDRYAAFDALIEREPGHIGALHHAARVAASAGDGDRAMRYLRALEAAGFDDALEPADFASLAGRGDYRALAARFAAAAPAVGTAVLHAETDCLDALPEGAAYDARRNRFLMSSGRRRTVIAVDADGRCSELVPPGDGGLLAVLGMDVDAATDTLWVASAAAPFMRDADMADAGESLLSQIDLASGRVMASYATTGAALLNDLDLLADGRVAVTDSMAGTVHLLDPQDSSPILAPMLPDASFEGPNGIVALAGGVLLVADFHGLWLIDPARGAASRRRVATSDHRYLGGIDGLARDGEYVVAIQNLVGRGRVWRFRVDMTQARVTDLDLLLRQHPDLRNPTTGAVADRHFLFVADPNLQTFIEGAISAAPAGRRGHRILSLPLP
jgi:sugar lactone lactonase YvrE